MGLTGWRVWLRLCRVLLGFGLGVGVDGGKFCQPGSTFVTVWSPLVRLWSPGVRAGRRGCGERGMVRYSCSGVRVAGVGESGGVWWETVEAWVGGPGCWSALVDARSLSPPT